MRSFKGLIGDTPMLEIEFKLDDTPLRLYAKAEYYNLSGSIKDRMASYVLEKAAASGLLREGQPIVEVTSGNTGIAFSALGALTRHPVSIFMPDWVSPERKKLMVMYGATVYGVSREAGGFSGALALAERAVRELDAYYPRQFENQDNAMAHCLSTGAEIAEQLPHISAFTAGVGSGGTLMGVARRLRPMGVKIVAAEPDAVPLLFGGAVTGPHMIEGIGDDFIPALVDRNMIDEVNDVCDGDAVALSAMLAARLGLGVGISSGANFLSAALLAARGETVATVFPDDNKKYVSTLLSACPKPCTGSLAERIELIGYRVVAK
jgi:cysteine synthase